VLLSVAAATGIAGFTGIAPASAGPAVGNGAPVAGVEAVPHTWFIQLSSAPASDGTDRAILRSEKKTFRDRARAEGVNYRERREFETLWNGISVEASPAEINKIVRSIPGVTAVWPVIKIDAPPKGEPISPNLFTAIQMTGADIAQNELGFTGKGVKVAVVDTGIDVDHQDLGGDGVARHESGLFPTARVAYGYDFVGDDFNADDPATSTPVPDSNPDDCAGHGTHVAGIIGANGKVKGVAPEVTFGAYRVFGCVGSTTSDVMLAAMERAYEDGMQVLNMSIGSSYQWPQYPTAVAASELVRKGVVVVASIGNSGANGLYSAGAPGLGKDVIGVASFDNTNVYLPYLTANGRKIGYVTMTFSPNPPVSGGGEVVNLGEACAALPAGSATGKIALAARGTCSFAIKATNAINAGAIAVLISNNAAGVFSGTLGAPLDGVTPVVGISLADGNFLRAQATPLSMAWTDQQDSFPSPTGGLISSFSSYGLSPDLALKPDIAAPGGNIYSTFPLEQGGYATLSGTSMSSPHVAGTAALLLQAKRRTRASDVRTILQNTSVPHPWFGNPGLGIMDNVHRQGAGMVQIDKAILATTMIEPGKISAGESEAGPYRQKLRITNSGRSAVTYDLSYVNALSTGGVITPSFWGSDATVTFSAASVTVPPGREASVTATINPATGPDKAQYGGYIVFTPQGGGQVYRVPFAGFVGDYQSIVALTPTANGFPWLAISYLGSFYGPVTGPDDWVYTMQGEDVPWFLVHFEHQVREFQATIFDATTGKPVHPVFNQAFDEEYLPRNSTSSTFYAFAWDGTRIQSAGHHGECGERNRQSDSGGGSKGHNDNNDHGKCGSEDMTKPVRDGQYIIQLKALKANGDARNPAHWETWTSPVIAIDRP
jgi:subtilisin family serine protease